MKLSHVLIPFGALLPQVGEQAAGVEAGPLKTWRRSEVARHCRSGILAGYMDVYSTSKRSTDRRALLVCLTGEVFAC